MGARSGLLIGSCRGSTPVGKAHTLGGLALARISRARGRRALKVCCTVPALRVPAKAER